MRDAVGSRHHLRTCALLAGLTAVVVGFASKRLSADDAVRPDELLPQPALVSLSIERPLRLVEHPLVTRLWNQLQHSFDLKSRMAAPELDPLYRLEKMLQDATGRPTLEGLDALTRGGFHFVVTPGLPPQAASVLTAADGETLEKAIAETRRRVLAGTANNAPEAGSSAYRDRTVYRLGNAHYAVVGRQMLAATSSRLLESLVDKALASAAAGDVVTSLESDAPLAKLEVDLRAVRLLPPVRQALSLPSDNPGLIAAAGGWLDLVKRSGSVSAELAATDETLQFALRLSAGRSETIDALRGFFATGDGEGAAPPLEPPGTSYTASWFRDYASLWEHRNELLKASAVAALEKGDSDIQKQFSVFGADLRPSEVAKSLGPHFRIVVAEQTEIPYAVQIDDRLPAAALVVSLRDEETFGRAVLPLLRALSLISTFEQGLSTRESEYGGAKLTGLWFRDDEQSANTGNRGRFNSNPTWTITRGHFIGGSTRKIVEQAIDELDRLASASAQALSTAKANVTETQWLDFTALAKALHGIRGSLAASTALEQGWTVEEAEHEVDVFLKSLAMLGRLETRAAFGENGFDYRARLGD